MIEDTIPIKVDNNAVELYLTNFLISGISGSGALGGALLGVGFCLEPGLDIDRVKQISPAARGEGFTYH